MPAHPEPAPGHPEIERIVAPNPGPMTLEGTNTYVVAAAEGAYVIDPGPDDAAHLETVREAGEARGGLVGVLLTHSHSDHSAGVRGLAAPLLWGRVSEGGEAATLAGAGPGALPDLATPPVAPPSRIGPFAVIATPGHAADHVCFAWGRVCFCGDLVLGHGSAIVPPRAAGGSLADYMDSLTRVGALAAQLLAPGHGPWITDVRAKVSEYLEHRRMRERRLVARLEAGERSRAALLARVWDDVPDFLRPAAAVAMEAHLEKLEGEGRLEAITLVE